MESHDFPTTTLQIDRPDDFELLEKSFKLIRYVLPFNWKDGTNNAYDKLYNQLREQLEVPYIVFQNDRLESIKSRVIYALYDIDTLDENITELRFSLLSEIDNPLIKSHVRFHRLPLHLIVKLLLAKFSGQYPYFASNGDYYVYAKKESKFWHKCVEIRIHGALSNQTADNVDLPNQEYLISGHTCYFERFEPSSLPTNGLDTQRGTYFKLVVQDDYFVFVQLKPSELDTYNGVLYRKKSKPRRKPTLDYHNQTKSGIDEACRGYILFAFINAFQKWLLNYGIEGQKKIRKWKKHTTERGVNKKLDLDQLQVIYLFDARHNQAIHSITEYQKMLAELMEEIKWVVISDLSQANNQPTLILQDADKSDYEENGKLVRVPDPYKAIKRKYVDIPTQFINVNPNVPKPTQTQDDYLTYKLIPLRGENQYDDPNTRSEAKNWRRQFEVCVYQLYLKDVIINRRSVQSYLPVNGILSKLLNFAYLRKENYGRGRNKVSYYVLLRIINDKLVYTHIQDTQGWNELEEVCETKGYSWDNIEDRLLDKYFKDDAPNKGVDNLPGFDLVLMPNMVVEIEELDETLLYKYDEIEKRLDARIKPRPVSEFLLKEHFNNIRHSSISLTLENLEREGLLDDSRQPITHDEENAMAFYRKLEIFDRWIEETFGYDLVSYNRVQSEYEDQVAEIFGWSGQKGRKLVKLLTYYKEIWGFGAATGDDVLPDKGIYYDVIDNAYRVASTLGIKGGKQDKAFRIRRFDVIHGDPKKFDMTPFLESMSTQFVRYNRYTVYPYFFGLLNMYIEEILR